MLQPLHYAVEESALFQVRSGQALKPSLGNRLAVYSKAISSNFFSETGDIFVQSKTIHKVKIFVMVTPTENHLAFQTLGLFRPPWS